MRLEGKTMLVTGAGSGIGRATALLGAREGARVMVADIGRARADAVCGEIAAAGGQAVPHEADVSRGDQVQAMVAAAHDAWGSLDILVNNAGFGFAGSVVDTSEEDWDRIMSVNLKGVFLGCKAAIPLMRAQGGGAIVNTSSMTANVGIADRAAYCATKGGVAALTRAMAVDHARDGIRINAVGPGRVATPYFDDMLAKSGGPEAMRRDLVAGHLIERMATPEEVARSIVFLASEDASFITGTLLLVDGGFTAQ